METAIVTGGLGRSGRWIVDELAGEYDVVCVDLDHPGFEVAERENVTFRAADLADRGEALDLVGEVDPDVVVHCAAIPTPERHAAGRVFETNVGACYNVLVGGGRAGARVAWASSESVYGFAFAAEPFLPDELPVTEDHPTRPEDPYGTSKVAGEEVAKMVARRFGVRVASVRPSWIQYPGEYNCRDRDDLDRPVDEMDLADDPSAGNFWSYVDVRDVAALVAATVDSNAGFEGHEAFHCVAPDNQLGVPTRAAIERRFGGLPASCDLAGEESAFSVAKARRRLDWTPDHTWETAADESVPAPSLTAE